MKSIRKRQFEKSLQRKLELESGGGGTWGGGEMVSVKEDGTMVSSPWKYAVNSLCFDNG